MGTPVLSNYTPTESAMVSSTQKQYEDDDDYYLLLMGINFEPSPTATTRDPLHKGWARPSGLYERPWANMTAGHRPADKVKMPSGLPICFMNLSSETSK